MTKRRPVRVPDHRRGRVSVKGESNDPRLVATVGRGDPKCSTGPRLVGHHDPVPLPRLHADRGTTQDRFPPSPSPTSLRQGDHTGPVPRVGLDPRTHPTLVSGGPVHAVPSGRKCTRAPGPQSGVSVRTGPTVGGDRHDTGVRPHILDLTKYSPWTRRECTPRHLCTVSGETTPSKSLFRPGRYQLGSDMGFLRCVEVRVLFRGGPRTDSTVCFGGGRRTQVVVARLAGVSAPPSGSVGHTLPTGTYSGDCRVGTWTHSAVEGPSFQ